MKLLLANMYETGRMLEIKDDGKGYVKEKLKSVN